MSILYAAVSVKDYFLTHFQTQGGNDLYVLAKKAIKTVEKNKSGIFEKNNE